MKVYVTRVEHDKETGEFAITFPKNLNFIEALNLKDGELIVWEIDGDKITLKKKVDNG